jgi:predicted HTH domain antitoxin
MPPHENRDKIGGEPLMLAAAKLYEMGRLFSGAAARLAGVPRTVFLARLAEYGVDTFDVTEEELHVEARLAANHL